jgi:ATPase subunit of ABC transporter with duplicated ATPase domains
MYLSMKKNTLLYLDSVLVERAKQENINISGLTEEALKHALEKFHPRTAHEYLQRVLADSGRGLAPYGEAYLLPFQIASLKLENIGLFTDFDISFRKNEMNVIYGSNASGKTTIIRSILLALSTRHNYFAESENGKVSVTLFPDQQSVIINTNEQNPSDLARGYKCLVMDDFFPRVPERMIPELLEEMQNLKIQIIVTAIDLSKFPESINVIHLPEPKYT